MNAPKLPTDHALVKAVAKQLLDAISDDCPNDLVRNGFGPKAMLVIAEIVSAAAPPMVKLELPLDFGDVRPGAIQFVPSPTAELEAEIARLKAIIHQPCSSEFLRGASIEAEYQRDLHGVDTTDARFDWIQWYWVCGYLLGKALAACKSGEDNGEKAKHHLITTAGLLNNWYNVLTGQPAASVHSNAGKPVADRL